MPKLNRIDVHTHMIPPFWADALAAKTGKPSWGTPDWSRESALAVMDRLGVQMAMISLATPSVTPWDGAERVEMAQRVNDFGAGLRSQNPDRFGMFATLPMPDVDATLKAIGRAFDHYQANGVILLSSYKGVYLGDPTFAPVWDELNRHKAVVFIHPGDPELKPLPGMPQPVVDFPMDSTRNAVSMVGAGVLSRCKDVKVILSHAGGFLPYAATRFALLMHEYATKDKSQDELMRDFKRFYLDTALSAPDGMPSLMAFAEPGHVVFGSDNPYISPGDQAMFSKKMDEFPGLKSKQLDSIHHADLLFPGLFDKLSDKL